MIETKKNEETVVDHGTIRSTADLNKLNIIDWNRYRPYWKDPQHCLEIATSALSGMIFTVIETDLCSFPERSDFPGWRHAGNHESVGKDLWNYFHYCFKGELHFHDSPDFSGIMFFDDDYHKENQIEQRRFYGDIGKVSPIAILDTMHTLESSAYWISVADNSRKLTILENELKFERKDVQVLKSLLTPILERKHLTAHILYRNVFLEVPGGNIYIGDDKELCYMSQSQISKRVNLALSGEWKRYPVPRTSPQGFLEPSDLQPDVYTPHTLWSNL